jgi:hypothetical protein
MKYFNTRTTDMYESKKTKYVLPIGLKFVITQPRVGQVKAESNK